MNWMILLVVLVVLVLLMFINIYILKQIKSKEDRIITNIVVIQKDLIRLKEEREHLLKYLKNIPKEIVVKNVLKIP